MFLNSKRKTQMSKPCLKLVERFEFLVIILRFEFSVLNLPINQ